MRYVKPHFYDDFKCIADKCPDTCCAGWQIMIDEESLERYECRKSGKTGPDKRFTEPLNEALMERWNETGSEEQIRFEERLKKSIDWQEGSFYQNNGRCAMLNEKNLCDLVIYKGEEWLCNTCDRYPRHIEEFDGLREMSLSLSCPVAADMMLQGQEPMQFIAEEDEEPEPLEEEFEDFDFLLFTQLADARTVLFEIVQNRRIPIMQRMKTILVFGRQLQECLDENRLFDMEEVIEAFATEKVSDVDIFTIENSVSTEDGLCEHAVFVAMEKGRQDFQQIREGFERLERLERLRGDWTAVLDEAGETLYDGGYERYKLITEAFAGREDSEVQDMEVFLEQILMFFLYTYFCGAVYDDCIFSKVALAVFSAFYIQEFVMCKWFLSDKHIDKQDCIRIAYRYAREVEHSDENLVSLEEWLLEKM